MKSSIASLVLLISAVAASAQQPVPALIDTLQGEWSRSVMDQDGNRYRVVKQIAGNEETVSVYKGDELVRQHRVDFAVTQTEHVQIFTYTNYTVTAGPDRGARRQGSFSYLFQIRDDRWYEVHGLMNGEEGPVQVVQYERVKQDAP